jgi:hypothetical protein
MELLVIKLILMGGTRSPWNISNSLASTGKDFAVN